MRAPGPLAVPAGRGLCARWRNADLTWWGTVDVHVSHRSQACPGRAARCVRRPGPSGAGAARTLRCRRGRRQPRCRLAGHAGGVRRPGGPRWAPVSVQRRGVPDARAGSCPGSRRRGGPDAVLGHMPWRPGACLRRRRHLLPRSRTRNRLDPRAYHRRGRSRPGVRSCVPHHGRSGTPRPRPRHAVPLGSLHAARVCDRPDDRRRVPQPGVSGRRRVGLAVSPGGCRVVRQHAPAPGWAEAEESTGDDRTFLDASGAVFGAMFEAFVDRVAA